MKVLVCGTRRFSDPLRASILIDQRLAELPQDTIIIHGGAHGADEIADLAARRWFTEEPIEFAADWETHGRGAGLIRNIAMLNENPDLVIAFWNGSSPGTKHALEQATKRGIPFEIVTCQ